MKAAAQIHIQHDAGCIALNWSGELEFAHFISESPQAAAAELDRQIAAAANQKLECFVVLKPIP